MNCMATSSKMPIGAPYSSRPINRTETGDTQTIGTGGFGVESSCVSSDGVRSHGSITIEALFNQRRSIWPPNDRKGAESSTTF
jgi:hypothetical protein